MSGIFGFLSKEKSAEDISIDLKRMLKWNRIFGNSYEGCYESSGVAMGCCTEVLSDRHIQHNPVISVNDRHAVIDAVIYNRAELAEKCHAGKDISDAELLLLYISNLGPEALKDVNGDFSGAIYNDNDKTLLLFRDHMGIRPLFCYVSDDLIAFSTDLRGLISLGSVDATISEEWIMKTVSGYSADTIDNTAYENIHCVTPASYITVSLDKDSIKIRSKSYWRLRQHKIKLPDEKAYQKRLRELITDSVNRRLEAVDGPIGAELSGGLDSGIIDILINRSGKKGIYYSWSLDPNELKMADNDERLVIEDICKQENIVCNYTHMGLDYGKKVNERMAEIGIPTLPEESNDFRFAFPTWSNTYTLFHGAQYASDHGAKVVFTGHGGDEGVSHRCSTYEMYYNHEYYRYLRNMWSATHGKKHRLYNTVVKSIKLIRLKKREIKEPYINWSASPELLNQSFSSKKHVCNDYTLQFDYDPVSYLETGGVRNRLDNIALYGALSGVRYMVPYLDYRVVDFAVSIPRYLYLRGRTNRYIFREAFKDIMPDSLYRLRTKEDTSVKNLKSNPDWYESYAKRKLEIISKLNRKYWEKYLDFEQVDKLAKAGKPSDEEYADETRRLKCLLLCALAQNLVEKARQY